MVYGKVYFREKGQIANISIKEAVNISLNEPEGYLFDTGAGVEMKPSEAMAADLRQLAGPQRTTTVPQDLANKLARKDKTYSERAPVVKTGS